MCRRHEKYDALPNMTGIDVRNNDFLMFSDPVLDLFEYHEGEVTN